MDPEPIGTIIPHSDFGDERCCGCLVGIIKEAKAEITCNECGAVIGTVPAGALARTLAEMELTLEMCMRTCPHCGGVNLFAGLSEILAYTCQGCGKGVSN